MAVTVKGRQLFDIDLEPVSGTRFQPTGFPDIGHAIFQRPERHDGEVRWVDALLVESAQSVANRLESVGWSDADQQPVDTLDGLPYVRVVAEDGEYLTSSRTEAHRLASAFVKDSTLEGDNMKDVIKQRLGVQDDRPLAPREIARAVAGLDPLCLLHGVFFADKVWPAQPKIPRAVTGFIEAVDVRDAVSGGVKKDDVRHSIAQGAAGSTEGYGTIPYHRTEWTAARIVASFGIDFDQIDAYGLGDDARDLLTALARWEIRALLDSGLRLRTACDLAPLSEEVLDRSGSALEDEPTLTAQVRSGIEACRELFGDGEPLEVVWGGGKKKRS